MASTEVIALPTLHEGQVRAWNVIKKNQFTAVRCGRRWGKSKLDTAIACDRASKKKIVGFFAPDYKRLTEIYRENYDILKPTVLPFSQDGAIIRVKGGGRIDFWTLEDESAGRSRHYDYALIDEAAFTKKNMINIWERSIKPTLFDRGGRCIVTSNTNGVDEDNFFWRICNLKEYGFKQYHAPTSDNPLLPFRLAGESDERWKQRRERELLKLQTDNPPLVYQQEYRADFVDFSGTAFFSRDKLLVNGQPVPFPTLCDMVFATIDTAVKDGQEHDSTAVVYWAKSQHVGHPLVLLDWDIIQIEGALLETWLPTVYQRLTEFTTMFNCRFGTLGAFIEDKQSGSILLQQARRREWQAHPIESDLTSLGKDGRAISVSGYVYREMVKICQFAFDKVTNHKGITRNHFLSQLAGFKVGDKEAHKRADDLTDCFTYGIAIALGNAEGF